MASTGMDAHTHGTSESAEDLSGEGRAFSEREVGTPARLLSSSPVLYPVEARRAEVEADVPVQILVDTQGRVLEARSLSPHSYGLDEAAAKAIRTWQFSPALCDGRPVRVRMRWTVQFRLR
jgi:TonB family protein